MPEMIDTVVTFLEMRQRPSPHRFGTPQGRLAILKAERMPVHFYRYLYDIIGRDYNWVIRKRMDDAALGAYLAEPGIELFTLILDGCPMGFAELDLRAMPIGHIAYFGLMPEAIGRGLGRWFFAEILQIVWDRGPALVRINTCTLDHPRALPLYQRMGFSPYAQEVQSLERLKD